MITFSSQAEIALRSLLPSDRQRIDHFLPQLDGFSEQSSVNYRVKLLESEGLENLYMARVSPNFRIVFRQISEGVEIVDIFKEERLKNLKEACKPKSLVL
jgi:hypothetical protein